MIIDYYKLKDGISQEVLARYGYVNTGKEGYSNYTKTIRQDDMFITITCNRKTGRFEMSGYHYNVNIKDCIADLIYANLIEVVEFIPKDN